MDSYQWIREGSLSKKGMYSIYDFSDSYKLMKGHIRKNWKIRWFKLSHEQLYYYRTQEVGPLCHTPF